MSPTDDSILLDARELCGWYGAAQVLRDAQVQVRRGQVVALMGRNGAGKSTLLKCLMGLLPRRSGVVRFLGHDISAMEPYQVARLGLGYVPEDRRIFTDLTVRENLNVGRQPQRHWPDGTPLPPWTPDALFRLFPNLAAMTNRRASHMSGGEQQMLTVARTLMGNPFLVLLDEPSEGVSPLIVEQLIRTIEEIKRHGVGILLSEQNLFFAEQIADQAVVLEQGQIRYQGTMQALLADTQVRHDYLGL
ncbi:MAG: ABC transporter ATP-binding protein [Burkholderiaceae bacterium]